PHVLGVRAGEAVTQDGIHALGRSIGSSGNRSAIRTRGQVHCSGALVIGGSRSTGRGGHVKGVGSNSIVSSVEHYSVVVCACRYLRILDGEIAIPTCRNIKTAVGNEVRQRTTDEQVSKCISECRC